MFQNKSWKPIYFVMKSSKVKAKSHKKHCRRGSLHSCECGLIATCCSLNNAVGTRLLQRALSVLVWSLMSSILQWCVMRCCGPQSETALMMITNTNPPQSSSNRQGADIPIDRGAAGVGSTLLPECGVVHLPASRAVLMLGNGSCQTVRPNAAGLPAESWRGWSPIGLDFHRAMLMVMHPGACHTSCDERSAQKPSDVVFPRAFYRLHEGHHGSYTVSPGLRRFGRWLLKSAVRTNGKVTDGHSNMGWRDVLVIYRYDTMITMCMSYCATLTGEDLSRCYWPA